MTFKTTGIALLGALLIAVPALAQPQDRLPDDFAEMPEQIQVGDQTFSLVPDKAGESVVLDVPAMGRVTVTLNNHSLFDVSVALEKELKTTEGKSRSLKGIGFLDVDHEGNGGQTLFVALYPEPDNSPSAGSARAAGGLRGGLTGEEGAGTDDQPTNRLIPLSLDAPIEMTITTDGVHLTVTCPTILGQILTAGEEAIAHIVDAGRLLGYYALRVAYVSLGVAIIITYEVALHMERLFKSAARILKRVFIELGAGAKHLFVDILAKKVFVDVIAKKVFRDILAKKVFVDVIAKTVFRDVLAKKVFRDAIYGKLMRDWIWRGGLKRIGRFFAREFGGRTKQVETTFGAPVPAPADGGLPGRPLGAR